MQKVEASARESTEPRFSVVIATYDREQLVGRAIESVLHQGRRDVEIVVVDDASRDGTPDKIKSCWPQVTYLRQETNQGPGPARQRGIRGAAGDWVLILDDDDTLESGAFELLDSRLRRLTDMDSYPVVQFSASNHSLPEPFLIVRLNDYLSGQVTGDFTPVLHRQVFVAKGFRYPPLRIGGEHLLWWVIARDIGIPTWSERLVRVHVDAPVRLTSASNQIRRAAEYAQLQELTLEQFGNTLERDHPKLARTKRIGAATYHLLAGDGDRARVLLATEMRRRRSPKIAVLWAASFLPSPAQRALFLVYRKATALIVRLQPRLAASRRERA